MTGLQVGITLPILRNSSTLVLEPGGEASGIAAAAVYISRRWHQAALAAYRQKSRIHCGGTGLSAATWASRMATVPVDGVMCADVPVPPTQP